MWIRKKNQNVNFTAFQIHFLNCTTFPIFCHTLCCANWKRGLIIFNHRLHHKVLCHSLNLMDWCRWVSELMFAQCKFQLWWIISFHTMQHLKILIYKIFYNKFILTENCRFKKDKKKSSLFWQTQYLKFQPKPILQRLFLNGAT